MTNPLTGRFLALPAMYCGACLHSAHMEHKAAYVMVLRCLNRNCDQFDIPYLYEPTEMELHREPQRHPHVPPVPGA
jgi:hypothetical protein